MATRQERIDALARDGVPPADEQLEVLSEDHVGTYVVGAYIVGAYVVGTYVIGRNSRHRAEMRSALRGPSAIVLLPEGSCDDKGSWV